MLIAFSVLGAVLLIIPSIKTSAQQGIQLALAKVEIPFRKLKDNGFNIIVALIEPGKFGRHRMAEMVPRYITIHSTQNYAPTATAEAHSRALANGYLRARGNSLGYLTWHFSVDENSIYQSLPTTERGEHADYNGPGNLTSIGIEMCENAGSSREKTLERTARLTAWLMKQHDIPISHVVPHQHWQRIRPRDKRNFGQKNCPHFLMDNGKPGAKWQKFLDQISSYLKTTDVESAIMIVVGSR